MLNERMNAYLPNKAPVQFTACLSAIDFTLGSIIIPDKMIKAQRG